MSGRIEILEKKEQRLLNRLEEMPSFIEEWFYDMSGFSVCTKETYLSRVSGFLKFLNKDLMSVCPTDITKNQLAKYLNSIKKKTSQDGTIKETTSSFQRTTWDALCNLCKFLVSADYLDKNPMSTSTKPKYTDLRRIKDERVYLTEGDFDKILNTVHDNYDIVARNRDYAIISLLLSTGIRETALLSLDVDDFNSNDKTITFVDKGDKYFKRPLPTVCSDAINDWLNVRFAYVNEERPSNALFLSLRGNRLDTTSLTRLVKKYTQEAIGQELSPHKLRGGYITVMYSIYGDIEKVRRMVGHENISTTARYIQTDGNEQKESADMFDKMFGGAEINFELTLDKELSEMDEAVRKEREEIDEMLEYLNSLEL